MTPFIFAAAMAATSPLEPGRASARIFSQGSMQLRWYAPRSTDGQEPHTQDEIYVVVSGQGQFRRGEDLLPFGAGDAIFVPAGIPHRFEAFSDDLGVWVVFYGPQGGEHD
ncbi:cupin domain-containing protein [Sediminicoccus sp. KRV36]|uniref:cupin domain-containing protein n=1 Tax=Sediminicoccus sp. KRV36 TaxID=3133721 RepID=UPI00200DA54C|nr:cupin domain-containing protein [Sediminicoccus rosea]UPY37263.1 cupin domain-containing protein [Sediminicoccus rosea]